MVASGLWNVPDYVLLRRKTRTLDHASGRWRKWVWDKTPILTRENNHAPPEGLLRYKFEHGGQLHVAPGLLPKKMQAEITNEVMGCSEWFRAYPIQGVEEPRAHYLLHKDATEDFTEPQPGYKYRVASLKAHPFTKLPQLQKLAVELADLTCSNGIANANDPSKTFWNLGVDVVLYRNGKDQIGQHRDNAQGENVIFTVLAQCQYRRRILIENNDKSVRYELFLRAGDGYCMDDEMQKHYTHGVPAVGKMGYKDLPRIALVFRRGDHQMLEHDTGRELADLMPRGPPPSLHFGQINGLDEGHNYSLRDMVTLQAHVRMQVGVCGNKSEGCNSILVATENGPDKDCLVKFNYTADQRHGGYRLATSAKHGKPVRVFRSCKSSKSVFRALQLKKAATTYRFDGLYHAKFVKVETVETQQPDKTLKPIVYHTYRMVRAKQGSTSSENRIKNSRYGQYCIDRNTMLKRAKESLRRSKNRGEQMNPVPGLNKKKEMHSSKDKDVAMSRLDDDATVEQPSITTSVPLSTTGQPLSFQGLRSTHDLSTIVSPILTDSKTTHPSKPNKKRNMASKMRKQMRKKMRKLQQNSVAIN